MRGPSDNEAYRGQSDPDAVEPTEIIPPRDSELADAFVPMDEALVAEMRGLVQDASTVQEILNQIILEEDGPEKIRLLLVGAAAANASGLSEQRSPGSYFMEGVAGHYKADKAMGTRKSMLDMIRTIDEIGIEVYREAEGESEAV